jgi:hypothetical protein
MLAHLIVQLHVLGVDAQHLQPAGLIRHADVDLTVKAPEAAQRSIDGVGPAGCRLHSSSSRVTHTRAKLTVKSTEEPHSIIGVGPAFTTKKVC